jgi:Ca-activated chloride channel family protein
VFGRPNGTGMTFDEWWSAGFDTLGRGDHNPDTARTVLPAETAVPFPPQLQISLAVAVVVFLVVLAAEKLHDRRCRTVVRLATGPSGGPRRWVSAVPITKGAVLAGMAWALTTLYYEAGGVYNPHQPAEERREHPRHVVFVADLSPSMTLRDAGPKGGLTRAERSYQVVDAILERLDRDVVYSVIGFYTDAMPVVVDALDPELVRNVFDGLPAWYAMEPGKTELGIGVRKTLERLVDYPQQSVTAFICTDGDTMPVGTIPKPPPSVADVYVLGVGDPQRGTFIDGHMSRQDASVLRTLAGRLHGEYFDVNEKHVPTLSLGTLAAGVGGKKARYGLIDLAIMVFAATAAVLALIPVLLEYFGSDWKTVRIHRFHSASGATP